MATPTSKSGVMDKVAYQMLSEDFCWVLRMVMRASLVPTWRASSLTGLSRDCPAKAVEAHAVAAAIAADGNTIRRKRWREVGRELSRCVEEIVICTSVLGAHNPLIVNGSCTPLGGRRFFGL